VEPLGASVSVNGQVTVGAVEAVLPVSVEFPSVTLVLEAVAVQEIRFDEQATLVPEGLVWCKGGQVRQPAAESGSDAPLRVAYRLVREIARGGMWRVYFGADPHLERLVAMKVSSLAEGGMDTGLAREADVKGGQTSAKDTWCGGAGCQRRCRR
jgi:hypothetical protein